MFLSVINTYNKIGTGPHPFYVQNNFFQVYTNGFFAGPS